MKTRSTGNDRNQKRKSRKRLIVDTGGRLPFTIEKKLVVQIRYYEYMYVVRDRNGERVYTGTDERIAKAVQTTLNGDAVRRSKRQKR